jgi:A/G-specific adenine glycosylase
MRIRSALLAWYRKNRRDLPWRNTRDPYRIWVSEVMLQQTRVSAVIPFYEEFTNRFQTIDALALASEQELLASWAGLGYYSRARNLQRAARIVKAMGFEGHTLPRNYEFIRALPGIGDYTAAAIASIAFDLPHAVVDGNVIRVLSRMTAESSTRARLAEIANALLSRKHPGDFNQAIMELGATVCLPRDPQCGACPIAAFCEARRRGSQLQFPVKQGRARATQVEKQLLVIERGGNILLWQRPAPSRRLAGFWELPEPEQLPKARLHGDIGSFRHSIVNTQYRVQVLRATLRQVPTGFQWLSQKKLHEVPLSTTAKKGLLCSAKWIANASPGKSRFLIGLKDGVNGD